jgi:cytochrome c
MGRSALGLLVAGAVLGGWALPAPSLAQAQTTKQTVEEEQDWQGLPPGKGREETFYLCVPCHSLRLVTQQGLSASRWNEAIDWMVEEQEMPPLDPEDRKLIVDYLAKYYGEDRNRRRGRKRRLR